MALYYNFLCGICIYSEYVCCMQHGPYFFHWSTFWIPTPIKYCYLRCFSHHAAKHVDSCSIVPKKRDIHSVCKNAPHETPQIPTCSKNKRGILTSFPFNDFSPTICQQCQFQSFSFLNSECILERQKTYLHMVYFILNMINTYKYNVHMCVYTNYPFLCSVLI